MTTIWPLVKAAPAWLVMSVVFGALAEMLVVDLVPLGPLFLPAVAATSAAILVATLGATFLLLRKTATASHQRSEKRWTGQQKAIGAAVFVIAMVLMIPTGIAQREFQERTNRTKGEAAKLNFTVIEYPFDGERFDEGAVNQTLAELEDSYQELKNEWGRPDRGKMQVHLFRNLDEYQARLYA